MSSINNATETFNYSVFKKRQQKRDLISVFKGS